MKASALSVLIVLTVLLLTSGDGGGGPPPLPPPGEDVTELGFSDWHGGCRLQDREEGAEKFLSGYPNLKKLEIGWCDLQEIPEAIYQMKNLEYLDLRGNSITTISEEISNLINLKILLLSSNKITELPDNIGHLMNLKELNLEGNQLSILPSSIVNLINIKDGIRLENNNNLKITGLSTGTITNGNPKGLEENIIYLKENLRKAAVPIPPPRVYTIAATSGLSVRNKPKLKAKKIGAMPYKLKIAVYGESSKTETIDGITAPWMRITALANGQYMEGWTWSGYLKEYKYEKDYPRQFQEMVNATASKIGKPNFSLDKKRVLFFIKNGVDINTQSDQGKEGWTLLNIVAREGNIKDFLFLLENGADFQLKSEYGVSVARSVAGKGIDIESKKAFFSALQDYGYDFKSEGKRLLEVAIYSFFKCGVTIEEVEEQGSELLDFLKEKLDIKHISEILTNREVETLCGL